MVAVNTTDDNENEAAVVCPRPQSLPAFVGRGVGASGESPGAFAVPGVGEASSACSSSAVSSLASQGGVTRKTGMPVPPAKYFSQNMRAW